VNSCRDARVMAQAMMLCVAVYCSVLQCVAVCCSVLQCVERVMSQAMSASRWSRGSSMLQCGCSVWLQCVVAMCCCSVLLQCVDRVMLLQAMSASRQSHKSIKQRLG